VITKRDNITIHNLTLKYKQKISRFNSLYVYNYDFILDKLSDLYDNIKNCDYVIIQAIFAPLIAQFCIKNKIPYHYYLRDELQLNIFKNYEKGFRFVLKTTKNILENNAIKKYKKLNALALKNASKIIVNSKYMQKELKKRFNLDSNIYYPFVDTSSLKRTTHSKNKEFKDKKQYILFIGGNNAMKGNDIVLKIAKSMPKEKFLIVGPYKTTQIKNNVAFTPWKKDISQLYNQSKLLLVPSRWNEAFGRVVVEANYFGIPTITSDKGGLPEANKDKNLIITDLDNINSWTEKIRGVLK